MKQRNLAAGTAKTVQTDNIPPRPPATDTDAVRFLQKLEQADYPTFTSADGVVSWKHLPVGIEAFIATKSLPDRFTAVLKRTYEAGLNKIMEQNGTKIAKKVEKEVIEVGVNAEEFIHGLKCLVVETAVSPRFTLDDEHDPVNNILSVKLVIPYLHEYFAHIMGAFNGMNVKVGAGEVSADALKEFPDSEG